MTTFLHTLTLHPILTVAGMLAAAILIDLACGGGRNDPDDSPPPGSPL